MLFLDFFGTKFLKGAILWRQLILFCYFGPISMLKISKNKISKTERHIIDSRSRVIRWLLCQQIGKTFYYSDLPFDRLEQVKEFFERSDFFKEEIFNPKLK